MEKIFFNTVPIIVLSILIQMFFSLSDSFGSDFAQSKIVLTTDPASGEHQEVFSGHDTIYALVTLSGLDPGNYTADVNWMDPVGNVNQHTPISFTIQPQSSYTFYSWLRLMKNGPFKSGLTGNQFDGEYLGRWELHIFINNSMLEKVAFEIR